MCYALDFSDKPTYIYIPFFVTPIYDRTVWNNKFVYCSNYNNTNDSYRLSSAESAFDKVQLIKNAYPTYLHLVITFFQVVGDTFGFLIFRRQSNIFIIVTLEQHEPESR